MAKFRDSIYVDEDIMTRFKTFIECQNKKGKNLNKSSLIEKLVSQLLSVNPEDLNKYLNEGTSILDQAENILKMVKLDSIRMAAFMVMSEKQRQVNKQFWELEYNCFTDIYNPKKLDIVPELESMKKEI